MGDHFLMFLALFAIAAVCVVMLVIYVHIDLSQSTTEIDDADDVQRQIDEGRG